LRRSQAAQDPVFPGSHRPGFLDDPFIVAVPIFGTLMYVFIGMNRHSFNRKVVRVGNLYQAAALKLMKIPKEVSVKTIETEGYQIL